MRLGVLGVAFAQSLRLGVGQLEPQPGGDPLRDLLLYGDEVGETAFIPRAPEVAAVARVRQFRADRKNVAAMRDAPGEHGADAQTPRNGRRVTLVLFEAEDGVARLHLDAGQLRQAVDQTVGQSVGQIFRFRVDIFAWAVVD